MSKHISGENKKKEYCKMLSAESARRVAKINAVDMVFIIQNKTYYELINTLLTFQLYLVASHNYKGNNLCHQHDDLHIAAIVAFVRIYGKITKSA